MERLNSWVPDEPRNFLFIILSSNFISSQIHALTKEDKTLNEFCIFALPILGN